MSDEDKNKGKGNGGEGGNANDDKNLKTPDNSKKPDGGSGEGGSTLTEEQLKVAFQHPRFKELAAAKQELDELKANQSKADDEKLKKNQEFETLATKREAELQAANTRLQELQIQIAVERAATKAGIVDSDAAYKLIDRSKVKVNNEGQVEGIDEAIKSLVESKPYLIGKGGSASTIGAGSNPAEPGQKTHPISWVRKQWRDVAWCRAKHDDLGGLTGEEYLNKVEAEGRIDYNS